MKAKRFLWAWGWGVGVGVLVGEEVGELTDRHKINPSQMFKEHPAFLWPSPVNYLETGPQYPSLSTTYPQVGCVP